MEAQQRLEFPLAAPPAWRPPETLPSLAAARTVGFDTEGTGVNKHRDRAVGLSYAVKDGPRGYLPWGHRGGGNFDKEMVMRWARRELAGKELVGVNLGHDVEQMRHEGVDLEALGCTLRDVSHSAALLDENRRSGFNLEELGVEYVGRGKAALPFPASEIWRRPANESGAYAVEDAVLSLDIWEAQVPQLTEQDLWRVMNLESEVAWVVNHMEREGARLDVAKMALWRREVVQELDLETRNMYKLAGRRVNPDSQPDMRRLFADLKMLVPIDELTGAETFSASALKNLSSSNEAIASLAKQRQLKSILSKYFDKYPRHMDGDLLRYTLHQLRGDEYGAVTGRFSSANVNVQQVFKAEKQLEDMPAISRWIVRALFIPEDGLEYFAADASQIEFRLFAHYSRSEYLINQYRTNPDIDFHQMVATMIGQPRRDAKHNNFGKVYGMGLHKFCIRVGKACNCACPRQGFWMHDNHQEDCPAHDGLRMSEQYDERFPEAKRLLRKCAEIAEKRGYVRTILGRRGRFDDRRGTGYHAALNKIIQGSAADVNKLKLVELYKNMRTVGVRRMRMTVHDEITGDKEKDPRYKPLMKELLDSPIGGLKVDVPLLWDVGVGPNWAECH